MLRKVDHLALEMLVGGQTLLDVARLVTKLMRDASIEGGVVGGIAVFLHGYHRTTTDVDVYVTDRRKLADALPAQGFHWNEQSRQFERGELIVQLLAPNDKLPFYPSLYTEIEGVRVVSLGDLISMKLSVGTRNVHRAQDWADVVRLVQALKLDKSFVTHVAADFRSEFKHLVDSLQEPPDRSA